MSETKTPFAVHCPEHGLMYLTEEQYGNQLSNPYMGWSCPECGVDAWWDDKIYDDNIDAWEGGREEREAAKDQQRKSAYEVLKKRIEESGEKVEYPQLQWPGRQTKKERSSPLIGGLQTVPEGLRGLRIPVPSADSDKGFQWLVVSTGYYGEGRIAISLTTPTGELVTTLTVNMPEDDLDDDEFFVKTWSENVEIARHCLDTGVFEDTGKRVNTNYVVAQVWRFANVEDRP